MVTNVKQIFVRKCGGQEGCRDQQGDQEVGPVAAVDAGGTSISEVEAGPYAADPGGGVPHDKSADHKKDIDPSVTELRALRLWIGLSQWPKTVSTKTPHDDARFPPWRLA